MNHFSLKSRIFWLANKIKIAGVLFFTGLIDLVVMLETWRRRHQASMQLARIDARVLRDAGISEGQRFIAVNRPYRKE